MRVSESQICHGELHILVINDVNLTVSNAETQP
jgi:hypothetical protein